MADRVPPGLNADVGEGFPHDAALLRVVDRASVACGGHAGSPAVMRRLVLLAARLGVAVGAHVSYPDRRRFGRVTVRLPVRRLEAALVAQARRLARICRDAGVSVDHVKPHGALYHDATRDRRIADAVGRVIRRLGPGAAWLGEARGWQERVARRRRIAFLREGFADRRYGPTGRLMPRGTEGSLLTDPRAVVRQVRRLRASGRYDTLCLHSDTPGCARLAAAARAALRR